jgi:hypothetical protein
LAPQLSPTFDGVSRISKALNERNESLSGLLKSASQVTAILSERSQQVNTLILNANELLGVRPRGVRVWVIGFERDVVHADVRKILESEVVPEEAGVDLTTEVELRRFADDFGVECPTAEFRPHVLGSLEEVRNPTHLRFGVGEFDVGETGEDAGENPVGQ